MKLLRAFFVFAPLVGLFGCTTVTESGRKQLILTSAAQETQMGLAAFTQIKREEKISHDVMANDRVTEVGRRIARSVGRDLPEAKWEFVVFDSAELNAFALPGGKVGVYLGLLNLAESNDELAAVIGHEIAHVTSRHAGERMSHQMLASGVQEGSEMIMDAKDVDPQKRAITRTMLGIGTTVGAILPFSRLHESEADAIGLRFAAGAGYDPRAAVTFWQRMQKANEGQQRPPEFLSTHPSSQTRIADLKRLAPNYLPLYRESKQRWERGEFAEREIGVP